MRVTIALLLGLMLTGTMAFAKWGDQRKGPRGPLFPFEQADTDKDGAISQEEWKKHHADRFADMDTNKDGKLDRNELQPRRRKR
jgi:hypothetical protein